MADYERTVRLQPDGWPVGIEEGLKPLLTEAARQVLLTWAGRVRPAPTLEVVRAQVADATRGQWAPSPLWAHQYATIDRALRAAGADPCWMLPSPTPEKAPEKRRLAAAIRKALTCPRCGAEEQVAIEEVSVRTLRPVPPRRGMQGAGQVTCVLQASESRPRRIARCLACVGEHGEPGERWELPAWLVLAADKGGE